VSEEIHEPNILLISDLHSPTADLEHRFAITAIEIAKGSSKLAVGECKSLLRKVSCGIDRIRRKLRGLAVSPGTLSDLRLTLL
jgi:hypothetical protein